MSNFYCAAPWRGLHINPRGDVKTCCAGDPNMLGNLNSQTIEQILHGPVMQQIRQSIRRGEPHAYCYNCVQAERYGRSERDWHNNVSPEFDCQTAEDTEYRPTLIDVRWNTTCNLSCNYCAEACSSKWAALKQMSVASGARPYYEAVCDYLSQHHDHIREVALVGGEPLLLPENVRLLDVIPPDCVVTLITNVSVELENNRVFKKLAQRKNVGWSLSFDNVGDRFEYVRHGADWNLQLRNLDLVQDLMKNHGHWGGIHAVYNLYNATRLVEFKQFATERGLSIMWQALSGPKPLDPTVYGVEVAQLAAKEIQCLFDTCELTPEEQTLFQTSLAHYKSKRHANPNMLGQLKKFVEEIESFHPDQRGKFAQLWPEISTLL
jgi:hypothetical protein